MEALRIVSRFRHSQLLVMLALLLLLNPFLRTGWATLFADVLLLATFLSTVFAFAASRLHLAVGLLLTVAVQAAHWWRTAEGIDAVTIAYTVLGLAFFGYFTALVLRDVFSARDVSLDTIAGALAAYLLIGVFWAFGYALLEMLVPGSIVGLRDGIEGEGGYGQFLGYSFVTLTTLGYGNVVPGNAKADMIASAEAIVGQLYLTVLVARLVAMSLSRGRAAIDRDEASDGGP